MKKTELTSEFLHGSTESFQWTTSALLGGVPCLSQGLFNRWLLPVWVTFHSSLHPRTSCVSLRGVHITNSHKTQKLAAKVVPCGTVTKKDHDLQKRVDAFYSGSLMINAVIFTPQLCFEGLQFVLHLVLLTKLAKYVWKLQEHELILFYNIDPLILMIHSWAKQRHQIPEENLLYSVKPVLNT